jgi:hypothetical protein
MANKPQPVAVETPKENESLYEQKNVHEVYEIIANHFSDTRYKVILFFFFVIHFILIMKNSLGLLSKTS